ncbi:MAG: hemerythrin domain-containing protein [Planctomycetes bacterium]|nr:hemerythrin domain-containing protein [Planctomycetota bacterium]
MQRPTDTLRGDHAITSRGIEVLRAIATHVRGGGEFPTEDAATLLRFLREFLLAVHLRKESEVLCPAVAMGGDERAAALVGDLVRMHEEVGELLHTLVLFWEPVGELTTDEQQGFADTATTFASLVARMQGIEEERLFPACDATVPADDQLSWNEQFAQFDRDPAAIAAWRARLDVLAARWLA